MLLQPQPQVWVVDPETWLGRRTTNVKSMLPPLLVILSWMILKTIWGMAHPLPTPPPPRPDNSVRGSVSCNHIIKKKYCQRQTYIGSVKPEKYCNCVRFSFHLNQLIALNLQRR